MKKKSKSEKRKAPGSKKDVELAGAKTHTADKNPAQLKSRRTRKIMILIAVLILIFIIGSISTYVYYSSQRTISYAEYNMSLQVTQSSTSFDTATDKIDFAKNYLGGGGEKMINLYTKKDAFVHIAYVGNITQFITLSDNDFMMYANTTKEVKLLLSIPDNSTLGRYEGKLMVYFYRP